MQNLPNPITSGNSLANPNPALQDNNSDSQVSSLSGLQKEQEPIVSSESGIMEEVGTDFEIEPQLASIGVVKRSETIELPPDMARMGVYATGSAQPVITVGTVQLPLTDDQIIVGLHAQIVTSLRWLAEWCIKQLKKAHTHLKITQGKAVREKI